MALLGCEVPHRTAPPPKPADSLAAATARGDLHAVHALLAAGADANALDADGASALHAAAFAGYPDILKLLIDAGGRVNQADHYGFTPLHAGAREGHVSVVRLLVERGADISAEDESGLTPLQVARFMNREDVVKYITSLSTASTVKGVLEPRKRIEKPAPEPEAIFLTGVNFRVWSSRSGAQIEAEFLQNVLDTVMLRKRDGNFVRIALPQLTPEDQALVRKLSGLAPPIRSRLTRIGGGAGGRADSIALRLGRTSGWEVLEGCRLLSRSGNDGDSFHVMHNGKEYIFRLYYVDTAETNLSYPARVADQARYFGISTEDTLRLGKEAVGFTARILSKAPFTVVTQWTDARGNSRLPRHYAFVITDDGDLDELLTAEGLVRVYGMKIDSGYGTQKQRVLKQLELEAKRDKLGAWGVDRNARAEAR